jgi:Ca2+-binding RTX toxin-like protein
MIHLRVLAAAAIGAASLAAYSGSAGAAFTDPRISVLSTAPAASVSAAIAAAPRLTSVCDTGPGTPSGDDALVSTNAGPGTSLDVAGAADFTCAGPASLDVVVVPGVGGAPGMDTFNVTIYADSGPPTPEPDDVNPANPPICQYDKVTGSGTAGPNQAGVVTIPLSPACSVPTAGLYWLSVQSYNTDITEYWAWGIQTEQSGQEPADWRDVYNFFALTCATFDNGVYVDSCPGVAMGDLSFALATCTITGTAAAETLDGTTADDIICGLGGDDLLRGHQGNDLLLGGDGNDVLRGGLGKDTLDGNAGNDALRGRQGGDWLTDVDGIDDLRGNAGPDFLNTLDGAAGDTLKGGNGADTCSYDTGDVLAPSC